MAELVRPARRGARGPGRLIRLRSETEAGSGEVIATSSESYGTKAGALNGIESIKKNAAEANVDDQTD